MTATWDRERIVFANTEGYVIAEYLWSPKGAAYVCIGNSCTRFRKEARPKSGNATDALRHRRSPMSWSKTVTTVLSRHILY